MGWTSFKTTKSKKDTILDEYRDSKFEIIDISLRGRDNYVATRNKETGEVFAEVILYETKDGEVYLKDMTECCNPYYYNCPKRILYKLSPTTNENALKWREACRNKPKNPKYGDVIKLENPLRFTDGVVRDTFVCVKYRKSGKRYRCTQTGIDVRITNLKDRKFSLISS